VGVEEDGIVFNRGSHSCRSLLARSKAGCRLSVVKASAQERVGPVST
jgi:hypothetical protein